MGFGDVLQIPKSTNLSRRSIAQGNKTVLNAVGKNDVGKAVSFAQRWARTLPTNLVTFRAFLIKVRHATRSLLVSGDIKPERSQRVRHFCRMGHGRKAIDVVFNKGGVGRVWLE